MLRPSVGQREVNVKLLYLSHKRHEMMFAQTVNFNILHNDHFTSMSLVREECAVQDRGDVGLVALGQEQECLCVSRGGGLEAFAVGVLPDALQQCSHRSSHFFEPLLGLFGLLVHAALGDDAALWTRLIMVVKDRRCGGSGIFHGQYPMRRDFALVGGFSADGGIADSGHSWQVGPDVWYLYGCMRLYSSSRAKEANER